MASTSPKTVELLDGPVCRGFRRYWPPPQVSLAVAVMEAPEEPGRAYKTLMALGRGGRLASYQRIHLYDAQGFGESTLSSVAHCCQRSLVT